MTITNFHRNKHQNKSDFESE